VTLIPSVHYVKNGEFTLAHQITGTGPKDIVYLPNESPNVVGNWIVPEHVRFIERLASFARVVLTDRRGMGCSDRLPPVRRPRSKSWLRISCSPWRPRTRRRRPCSHVANRRSSR
jgi:hypothetical protein